MVPRRPASEPDGGDELSDGDSAFERPEPEVGDQGGSDGEPEPTRYVFVNEGSTRRLDVFLQERLPDHSRSYLKRLIDTGYASLQPGGARDPKPSLPVRHGVTVELVIPPPLKVTLRPEPIPLDFIYQDEHLAVINKPAGLTVHPAPHQPGGTLVNALLHCLEGELSGIAGVERPGIVHRLDKETSGALIVAKNDVAHRSLAAQFKERQVHKTYLAIARGKPRDWEGRIDFPLGRSPSHSKKIAVYRPGEGRAAITDYRVLEVFDGYTLIECYPLTGRTHQIRVHLQASGLPISCDKLYSREKAIYVSNLRGLSRPKSEAPILERHALHAASICFRHPVFREEVSFQAPLATDMLAFLHALQRYRSPR